ncbi:MAG: hypothetical protein RBT34_09515 [Anaerolineaceae bacterium]|jgi:hypothetical protein|nr:hypothetical protein [Anaerolineaceae bacterium]
MEYANWKTITGMTIADLRTALDKELPKDAYKAIPEAPYLTDINPGYMKKCLNDVFGICGVGWGYEYSPDDLLFQNGSKDGWTDVLLKSGQLWFKLVDDAGEIRKIAIPASGGSENKQIQYALKGAITNMIGNAASQIGFQESVYMGTRSHVTTNGSTSCGQNQSSNKQTEKSTEDTKPKAQATPMTPVNTHPAAEAKPTAAPAASPYLVPNAAGIATKHQGIALTNMSDAALQFYAADSKFSPTDDAGKDFRQKCLQETKARAQAIA